MKRRKWIILTMAAVLALGVSACGNATTQTGQEPITAETTEQSTTEAPAEETMQQKPEETEADTATEENAALNELSDVEGMVIEEAANYLSIMTQEGETLFFSYPENGVETELEEGMQLGEMVKISYTGSADTGDATAISIEASAIETTLDRAVYEFALFVIESAKLNDLAGLSQLVSYPVSMEIGDVLVTVKTPEDFAALNREDFIPLGQLADYNLFELSETQTGYVIGDSKLNVAFSETEDGYGITDIHIE